MPALGYLSLSQKKKLQLAIKTEEDAIAAGKNIDVAAAK